MGVLLFLKHTDNRCMLLLSSLSSATVKTFAQQGSSDKIEYRNANTLCYSKLYDMYLKPLPKSLRFLCSLVSNFVLFTVLRTCDINPVRSCDRMWKWLFPASKLALLSDLALLLTLSDLYKYEFTFIYIAQVVERLLAMPYVLDVEVSWAGY